MNRYITAILLCAAACALAACSSDPETPLGSEFVPESLIVSRPGAVFEDTIIVTGGDTSFVTNAVLFKPTLMTLGRKNAIESALLVTFNFTPQGTDSLKSVSRAEVVLTVTPTSVDTLRARFVQLATRWVEGDTLTTLALADTIADSTGTNTLRLMKEFPRRYTIEPSLVEKWIDDGEHKGIAVLLDDTTTSTEITFGTKENADTGVRPFLTVLFSDASSSTYPILADGTFVKELFTPSNLLLGDGVTRRLLFPIDLSSIDSKTLLHDAILVANLVPNSNVGGGDLGATLYKPNSLDVSDPAVLTGTEFGATFLDPETNRVEFNVRAVLEDVIGAGTQTSGFVLRFAQEGTQTRQIEVYGSAGADSLRPFLKMTFSEAPRFPR